MKKFQKPKSGLEDSPAKTSRWLQWGQELGLEGNTLHSFLNTLASLETHAPEFLSSRTFQGSSLATEAGISKSLFERWPSSGMAWDGVCLTAKTSESPNHVNECTLLDAVETGAVPERYFLSPNAAAGILRRTDRMGRDVYFPL